MDIKPIPDTPDVIIETQDRAFRGRFALDVLRFRHRRFNGTMSPPRDWEVFRRGTAAAVLPYDPWTDRVVLMDQFRIPAHAAGLDPVMTEVPAGLTDGSETPETTVLREIQEEIGLSADRLARIGDVLLSPGGCDERITLFAGRVHAPEPGPDGVAGHGGLADENEDIRVRVLPAGEAIERAVAGGYPNSVTTITLLWLAARREALRADWR